MVSEEDEEEEEREFVDTEERVQEVLSQVLSGERGVEVVTTAREREEVTRRREVPGGEEVTGRREVPGGEEVTGRREVAGGE